MLKYKILRCYTLEKEYNYKNLIHLPPKRKETSQIKIKVKVNDEYIFHISNIEMQIAFKNYLGSDKDLEDAKHLEIIFLEYINKVLVKAVGQKN